MRHTVNFSFKAEQMLVKHAGGEMIDFPEVSIGFKCQCVAGADEHAQRRTRQRDTFLIEKDLNGNFRSQARSCRMRQRPTRVTVTVFMFFFIIV